MQFLLDPTIAVFVAAIGFLLGRPLDSTSSSVFCLAPRRFFYSRTILDSVSKEKSNRIDGYWNSRPKTTVNLCYYRPVQITAWTLKAKLGISAIGFQWTNMASVVSVHETSHNSCFRTACILLTAAAVVVLGSSSVLCRPLARRFCNCSIRSNVLSIASIFLCSRDYQQQQPSANYHLISTIP